MYLTLLPLLLPLTSALTLHPQHPSSSQPQLDSEPLQHILTNPSSSPTETSYKIPTIRESAVLARRILRSAAIGTISSTFPTTKGAEVNGDGEIEVLENRPEGLGGVPIGLMEYIADCEPSGNPTLLAISIATTFKNADAGSNISLSLRFSPPPPSSPSFLHRLFPFLPFFTQSPQTNTKTNIPSPASQPRFSLLGTLSQITPSKEIEKCYLEKHPDAKYWLPGNSIHESSWMRLDVREVYWVGGFGDRAYIGWIPVDVWRGVGEEEVRGGRGDL